MLEDYEDTVLPLLEQYPESLNKAHFTFETFQIAASWVASRAFGVDKWHGKHTQSAASDNTHVGPVKLRCTASYVTQLCKVSLPA